MASGVTNQHRHIQGATGAEELRKLRLWQRSEDTDPGYEGDFWFNTTSGDKQVKVWDGVLGSAVALMRRDRNYTFTGTLTFSTGGAPFAVVGTTKVTNLNADLLDGLDSATAATGSTIAARESDGRLKCADPTDPTDATNLRWVRAELRNADDKGSVKCASIAALADSYTFSANEIEKTTNGAFPDLDGVTVSVGDYFALLYEGGGGNNYYKGSQNAVNGIWKLTVKGDGSTKWKAQRAEIADVASEVSAGMFFFIDQGTELTNSKWSLFTDDPVYLKTNAPKGVAAALASGGTLTDATTFYYKVTMVDYSGKEAATDTEVSETTANPNRTINLSWTAYTEAASYRIYRTTTSGNYGASSLAGTTTGTTFSDTGVSLTTGTPPSASALEFAKIGSNAFYQAGNGIVLSGDYVHAVRSSNYDTNAIIFASSTTALSMSTNLTWDGNLVNVNRVSNGAVSDALRVRNAGTGAGTEARMEFSANGFNAVAAIGGRYVSGSAEGYLVFYARTGGTETEYWRMRNNGTLEGVGARTIQTSTGNLTIATAAGNGNIVLSPNGSGNVQVSYLTQKSVLFAGASGAVSQDNANLQYDSTTASFSAGAASDSQIAGYFKRSGAKTNSQYAAYFESVATSSTASIDRFGVRIEASGTWNGTGAVNYALYIGSASGGTTNWAIYNNTAANVYLGTGNVGIGTASPAEVLHIASGSGGLNLRIHSRAFFSATHSTHSALFGHSVKADTAADQMVVTETSSGSGNGAPSAILMNAGDIQFHTATGGTSGNAFSSERLRITSSGNVGIGTTSPSYLLSLGGNSARTIGMERHTTADTAGNALTLLAGGATSGATNKDGGNLNLKSGTATGSGSSSVVIQTAKAGASGTSDRSAATVWDWNGNGRATLSNTDIGATLTDTYGLALENITAATVGAQTQTSPALRFLGRAWDTDDTVERTTEFRLGVIPVAGASVTAYLSAQYQFNGGGYTELFRFNSTALTASTLLVTDANKAIVSGPAIPSGATAARVQIITITGNGSATTFTATHNLGITSKAIGVTVWATDDGGSPLATDVIDVDIASNGTNAVDVNFVVAPANGNKYLVVCTG